MADEQDNAQRTEEPTPKRLADARKKGDAPKSQEVTVTLILAVAALSLWLLAKPMALGVAQALAIFIDQPHAIPVSAGNLRAVFGTVSVQVASALAGLGALMLSAALAGNIVQARPVFTTERMKPSWSKLSPIAGIKRVFGPSGLVNFFKGLGKLVIMGSVIGVLLWADRSLFVSLVGTPGAAVMAIAAQLVLKLLVATVISMGLIAGLDVLWQQHAWKKRLAMTREEVRREMKETDGDPQTRGRQRQIRDARARRRTIAAVKDATVLIMNPTHYAVALSYQDGKTSAPICTAKGMDDLALRMRQVARDHQVPVVENPPLARALHANATLDQEIPVEHYEAVAKVIGFILAKARIPAKNGPKAKK